MKSNILACVILIGLLFHGCTKQSGTVGNLPAPSKSKNIQAANYARFSGPDYSQSIPVDTANAMIQSYLTSVNYPAIDTAIRSLSFDADTLRGYLQNSDIVTLKFMIAHRPEYIVSNNGVYAGLKPAAMTVVVVGQDESDKYILNNRGEVYEHMYPCPTYCAGSNSALIQQ